MSATYTISDLLKQELEHRCYATDIDLSMEDLFSREKLVPWIKALLGRSSSGWLTDCIRCAPTPRLSHTAAVYLLGMALRSNLDLHFDKLPRLISFSTGDGFHFYWAMTCLCHDLGYTYEQRSKTNAVFLRRMGTTKGRRKVLQIDHDLFRLDRKELSRLGIDPDSEEGQWILESVELARKYDRYRRQTNHRSAYDAVADHGICGALLLYDILRREHTHMQLRRKLRRFDADVRHTDKIPQGNLDGAAKDASPRRFLLSSLLIACTVARHNMWLASKPEDQEIYRIYGLETLFANRPGVKIRADKPMEQMLLFLDLVDTIDPVKGFYLRDLEYGPHKGESHPDYFARLVRQYDFVMNRVSIDFSESAALRFSLTAAPATDWEEKAFQAFVAGTASLPDWLELPVPTQSANRITYHLPFTHRKADQWPCGITDHEVNSLLLYMGCGVPGRYEKFYSSTRAYQTFNLLMMAGNEGEQIRVCTEHQKPNGLFLREWERSLETMTALFRTQCKYAAHPDTPPMTDTLYRSDRGLNFRLMCDGNATYAMTSTSRGSYLDEFLVDKVDPHILCIKLEGVVPYFDYEGFFREQYVYADEREVLLPPMLTVTHRNPQDVPLTFFRRRCHLRKTARKYEVTVTGFDLTPPRMPVLADGMTPEAYLQAHAAEAAEALDRLSKTHDMDKAGLTDPDHPYWIWKACWQYVLRTRFREIYLRHFPQT